MARVFVDIDLNEIEDTDLVMELIHRGYSVAKMKRNPDSCGEIMELFMSKNPRVCLADTLELENHMKQIISRV
jgi:hypothetical protein